MLKWGGSQEGTHKHTHRDITIVILYILVYIYMCVILYSVCVCNGSYLSFLESQDGPTPTPVFFPYAL